MQINLMDVRLDQQKRPYAVHETIREYGDESIVKINNPGNAVMLLNEVFYMKDLAEEHIYLIMIAANNQTLAFAEVARGFISKAYVGMREIMQRALLCNAAKIMIAHNHPSGDPEPSNADIDITQKLFDVCQLMEVEFCDHIIIGGDNYFSFREDYSREQKRKREEKKKEEQV